MKRVCRICRYLPSKISQTPGCNAAAVHRVKLIVSAADAVQENNRSTRERNQSADQHGEAEVIHRIPSDSGSVNVTVVPFPAPSDSAQIRPPCASTHPFEMANPKPEPFCRGCLMATR